MTTGVGIRAALLRVSLGGGAVIARMVIAELEMAVHIVADRLHLLPAALNAAEMRPGEIGELLRVAIAAAHQEQQRVIGQFRNRELPGAGRDLVGKAGIPDQEIIADFNQARWRDETRADIAKGIAIVARGNLVRRLATGQLNAVLAEEIALPRRMHAQHQHHRRWLLAMKGDVVPCPDDHFEETPVG